MEEKWAEKIDDAEGDQAALLVVAPYNTHVDNWKERARLKKPVWRAVKKGRHVMTAAAAFALPKHGGKPDPKKMAHGMHAQVKALVRKDNFKLIIDERDLLEPEVRAAIGQTLSEVRKDPRADGGVQVLEAGDPFQGRPYLNEANAVYCEAARHIGPREELTVDSQYMKENPRPIKFLTQVERFGEELYQKGSEDIRLGSASKKAVEFVAQGTARVFTEDEDLAAITIFGTTAEVMSRDLEMAPRRAAKLGLTQENEGVYVWDALAEYPELQKRYEEAELNCVRTFGLEKQVFYIGKRVLIVQKALLDEDGDEEEGPVIGSLQFDDNKFVSGNAPGTVVGYKKGEYIEVEVDRRSSGSNRLRVPIQWWSKKSKEGKQVSVPFPALKPYQERVVELTQSQEWSGPVHIVAGKIYGEGKVYVALTRCKELRNIKISDIEPGYVGLRDKLRSSWRALSWVQEQGVKIGPRQASYVKARKREYDNAFPSASGEGGSAQ